MAAITSPIGSPSASAAGPPNDQGSSVSGAPLPNYASLANRVPGPLQGIMLLLPITMSVAGITVFVATAALMAEHFKDLPNGEYLVQLLRVTRGNVTQASRLAGRNRTEFYKLLGRHALEPERFREG